MYPTIKFVFSYSLGFATQIYPAKKVATIYYPLENNKLALVAEYKYIGDVFLGKDPRVTDYDANSTLMKISPSRALWIGTRIIEFDLIGNEKILKFDSFGMSDASAPVVYGTKFVYFPDMQFYTLKSEIKHPKAPWEDVPRFPIRNWKLIANREDIESGVQRKKK